MITGVVDVQGKELNIGDFVAFGDTTSSYNAVICYGQIVNIYKKLSQTHIQVKIIKHGAYKHYEGKIKTFIYPRNYYNLMLLL